MGPLFLRDPDGGSTTPRNLVQIPRVGVEPFQGMAQVLMCMPRTTQAAPTASLGFVVHPRWGWSGPARTRNTKTCASGWYLVADSWTRFPVRRGVSRLRLAVFKPDRLGERAVARDVPDFQAQPFAAG
jgi:hypothetical protein